MNLLFPAVIDNQYRGLWIGLALFVPVLTIKTLMGVNVGGLNPFMETAAILEGVDGVPLSQFSQAAVDEIIFATQSWGKALVVLCAFGWLALIAYRAALPLAIALLALEQFARSLPYWIENGVSLAPAGLINLGLSGALALAFICSLIRRGGANR